MSAVTRARDQLVLREKPGRPAAEPAGDLGRGLQRPVELDALADCGQRGSRCAAATCSASRPAGADRDSSRGSQTPVRALNGAPARGAGDGRTLYQAPDAEQVPPLMAEVVDWLQDGDRATHVVVRAAMAHLHLVSVHPFRDGNGRIS